MYRIKTMNKISSAGLELLDNSRFQVGSDVENEDGILVRSAAMHDYAFPDSLRAIARAGAGTNNIPIDRCSENGIVVFNTPGANANAVKELVIAALLIASRDILGGAEWVQEQAHTPGVDVAAAVEKGKSAFVGPELYRKTLGVIGLGAIGALVCNIALDLGMDVYGYDPFLSVDAALRLDRHVHVVKNVDELYKVSDYITIHVPYNNNTKDFINAEAIATLKKGGRVLITAAGKVRFGNDVKQTYLPVFWNTSWFKMRPPHTTGAYIDTGHPLFSEFPTDNWTNLNWWELVNKAQVMNLRDFPAAYQPPVQPIDTWHISRKLGMVVEANVLGGKLLMTTIDIDSDLENRPVARQMRKAIIDYVAGDSFRPAITLDPQVITNLFEKEAPAVNMFTNDSPDELKPKLK